MYFKLEYFNLKYSPEHKEPKNPILQVHVFPLSTALFTQEVQHTLFRQFLHGASHYYNEQHSSLKVYSPFPSSVAKNGSVIFNIDNLSRDI